ncbi:haloacid dehalogenase-like hydrolase [Pyrenophora seminiperda CCB06]|uniref:Haloacid dehalogenase-like hydrolase n=1 Tax=Pyrenophora seminiperda CCB06 TaxID=1302712 RepID=A0A3M7MHZ3_9PLEO|nr:haloacid dehalogenase-like hydrolase [Pyrenophora seminiperda CCB06]
MSSAPVARPAVCTGTVVSELQQTKSAIHWLLDWDGTITRTDTLDALVGIAAAVNPAFPTLHHWQRLSKAYVDEYTATLQRLVPDGALPTTVQEEKQLLKQLRDVEAHSLTRLSSSAIFAGLTSQIIEKGAHQAITSRHVQLRTGFSSFLHAITSQACHSFVILSVNWSRHFIQSCLNASGSAVPSHAILANELDNMCSGKPSTGQIVPTDTDGRGLIISSGDKLDRMLEIKGQTVYVGDSWTDIECLLAADLGICMRDHSMGTSQKQLAHALDRLGIACPRLRDWHHVVNNANVAWARDFNEIREWVESRSV